MARSNEPVLWSLFAGGGALSAMLVPIHLLILGLVVPLTWGTAAQEALATRMLGFVQYPLGKAYILVLVMLSLFHWAHRFRFTLVDLGLKPLATPIAWACYLAAVAGTVWCAWVLHSAGWSGF